MKALIVAPSWIGDTVLAQPLFMRLHERTPCLQLDALAPRWVAPVLERMPEITKLIDSPFAHGDLSLKARHRLARQLAQGGYQRAYILPNSIKSALIPFFADIPERIGFVGESRYGLINRRHTLNKAQLPQMAERFAQLAEAPGTALPRPLPLPRLHSDSWQRAATLASLGIELPEKLAVFCPGAEYGPAKRWPARHFATLANALADQGYAVWLLGSPKDRAIGNQIVDLTDLARRPHNLCGATSLTQAIDLLAAAAFVVCNDSGLMHVAAALDRPLIALYGSSSPGFTPPLSVRAKIISQDLDCSPCFQRTCPLGHLDCLNKLDPQRVLDACLTKAIA
ncbi:MAG: lipopolysaccharide heptosyltransferase II [Candidatus Accumulibacter phosphatis]|jgi:heptosyltransferase-2|uniref:lipopolysaccharide heptosyltransferase II n=2 Tax=Candidatus Accumulibacter TaxID=327159 RepID=A0A080LSM5_9PROT|nr:MULTISPECIES: lipopolysaccharide heptosyltransferase II [Candidatus Accumulibacter]KFB71378.1 MAG: ADP-heptose--LPS heptosyltransferase 2 [Candidatus Accumulibacter phosphatis]MBL8406420.1 lipopolysaccharide heptosyltransferase II [Accumulibacter sp.]NMQ04968.1 lipopolysaccharide heptosyltransferase II [Candidatus Accumulibacter contiguus]